MTKTTKVLVFLGAVLLAAVGLSPRVQAKEADVLRKLEVLAKVLGYVETNYVEPVNDEKLIDEAIKG
ncbi:MAG: peptidase S41, partial [Pseudomonadota bacterium]